MIESFGNRLAEDLFYDRTSKEVRQFPPELKRAARRKLLYVHDAAELVDLRIPPGNRLEALKGKLAGCYSTASTTSGALCSDGKGATPKTCR